MVRIYVHAIHMIIKLSLYKKHNIICKQIIIQSLVYRYTNTMHSDINVYSGSLLCITNIIRIYIVNVEGYRLSLHASSVVFLINAWFLHITA